MELKDFYFQSTDVEHSIRVRKAVPGGPVKGVVQIAHGIAEHVERYDSFMSFLAENGFAVVANDHLGHGKSYKSEYDKGLFTEAPGWDTAVADMAKLHDLTVQDYPDVPYIIFGHSMGSFLARTYIIDYPEKHDLAILSGTGNQSPALIAAGCLMADFFCRKNGAYAVGNELCKIAFGSYLNKIPDPRTEYDWLSRDGAVVDAYIADENCGFTAKNGLYRDMMHGIKYITDKKNISKMDVSKPVCFMSGAEDPVGDYGKGVEKAYKLFCDAGCRDVMIRLYPGGRHEMLNELNKADVFQDVLNWIESRI